MKTAAKVTFWFAAAFLVGAIIALSFLVGNRVWSLSVVGLALLLAALICLTVAAVLFLKDDDRHNLAESHDEAPKAH